MDAARHPASASASALIGVQPLTLLQLLRPRNRQPLAPRPSVDALQRCLQLQLRQSQGPPPSEDSSKDTQCKLRLLLEPRRTVANCLRALFEGTAATATLGGGAGGGGRQEAVTLELPDGTVTNLQLALEASSAAADPSAGASCGSRFLLRSGDSRSVPPPRHV